MTAVRSLWIVCITMTLGSLGRADAKTAPPPPHWTEVAPLANARADHTTTALLDYTTLAVGGGETASGPGIASCELWDPNTRTWSPAAPLARARFAHTATRLADGRVIVIGGLESFGSPFPTEVEIYDPTVKRWSLAAPIPVPRAFHAAVLLQDGRVLVAGGDAPGAGDTATAYIYNPATNSWSPAGSMSVAREPGRFGAIVLPDGDVLVVGGYLVTTGLSVAAADRYDVATGTWTTLPDLAESRNALTLERLPDGRIVVIGGKNGGQIRSLTEIFDPATNQWAAGPQLNTGRWAHTTANLGNGRILAMGGRTSAGDTTSCEIFDVATGQWRVYAALHVKRFKFGSTMTTGLVWIGEHLTKVKRILVISGHDGTATNPSVEEIVIPVAPTPDDEQ